MTLHGQIDREDAKAIAMKAWIHGYFWGISIGLFLAAAAFFLGMYNS